VRGTGVFSGFSVGACGESASPGAAEDGPTQHASPAAAAAAGHSHLSESKCSDETSD